MHAPVLGGRVRLRDRGDALRRRDDSAADDCQADTHPGGNAIRAHQVDPGPDGTDWADTLACGSTGALTVRPTTLVRRSPR